MYRRPGKLRRRLVLLTISSLALAAACADPPSGARTPTELAPRAGAAAGGTYTLTVRVTEATGNRGVPGLTVVPFEKDAGPFTADGAFAVAETNSDGVAVIDGLAQGSYCVTVRDVPRAIYAYDQRIVPNPGDLRDLPTVPPSGANVGLVTGKSLKPVPFTAGNFRTYCQTRAAPLSLQKNTSIKLSLLGSRDVTPAGVGWTFLDLNGAEVRPGVFTVIELPTSTPWFVTRKNANQLPADVRPGLLVASTDHGTPGAGAIARGEAVSLQTTLLKPDDGQGRLTAAFHATAGAATDTTVYMQPLVCRVTPATEKAGDGNGGVDFVGFSEPGQDPQVRLGVSADPSLALDDRRVAIWFLQKGSGGATLNLRFVGGDVANLKVDYTCDGAGTVGVCTGTGQNGGVIGQAFGTRLDDGSVRVALVVRGIRPGVRAIDVQLATPGDQFPDAARSGPATPAGFFRLAVPDVSSAGCDIGYGSDDRFWVN
ncbi:MAG: hypothetical protein IRZ00_10460 [Gemmatimonadetes bacterium]|nr:hypothetical protein [Gemmatimonadota bacterium]